MKEYILNIIDIRICVDLPIHNFDVSTEYYY